ncbi:hypothetical protein CYMTET_22274 [Cymbomonas tetramitiformis]|uniref:HEAT repeat domain-containing protein n=1 Tax=Cymbomonas tetramitiformis TaxID=36881 RepID=A0AAE0G0C6_9CHLO|nr:hypothetical protein CYMTET_22274 [Cymbomonas tetramitiformis]
MRWVHQSFYKLSSTGVSVSSSEKVLLRKVTGLSAQGATSARFAHLDITALGVVSNGGTSSTKGERVFAFGCVAVRSRRSPFQSRHPRTGSHVVASLQDNLCTITHAHERSSFSPWPTRASHQEAYSSCLITIANELRQRPPYGDAGKNLEHGAEPQRHGCRLLCVREAAVEALGSLGEHAVPHAGAIAARLEDDDGDVRRAAVEALGRLGEHAGQHAGAIAILLEDANAGVRRAAVEALWRLGEHAVPDAGAVAARLEDANADVT